MIINERKNSMKKAFIEQMDVMAKGHLTDEYIAAAYSIEQALILSGATPGKDYSILDLFKLAEPYVIAKNLDSNLEFCYPAKELHER